MDAILNHPLIPVLTFLIGTLFGHRTALGRDRRQEFNAAALPIHNWALREIQSPGSHPWPSIVELDALTQRLSRWRRRRFNRAWDDHSQAHRETLRQDPTTGLTYRDDSQPMVIALRTLLVHCRTR